MRKLLAKREVLWKKFGFENLEAEEYKRRTTAVELGFLSAVCGIGYTLLYTYLGFPALTLAVIAYVSVFICNLLVLWLTKNYDFFRTSQLLACTFLPIAAQLLVGGFIQGSAVSFSAFLGPAGALLYTSRHIARRYFYVFMALIISVGIWEYWFIKPALILPRYIIISFFVINIASTFSIIYFILESFLAKLEGLRDELKDSLTNLKATQAQLIQAEKMASLGELTAGIAHEIQNPLNFVNNFSEVSNELIEELQDERSKVSSERDDSLENDLLNDIKQNNEKILLHGKRADAIVKGMLQHSRKNTGQKEPTDINALCDEYIRLSFHGLRAKDKSFTADFKTNFDDSIGKINVIPQDIGRVFLNLFNNAFYAVNKKKKSASENYKPLVTIATKHSLSTRGEGRGKVEIVVKDNGNGIPQTIIDKIFQPFFTTKPTGEGTGLGLSLSYDIIKAHGGTITTESKEGEGTAFIITLPL